MGLVTDPCGSNTTSDLLFAVVSAIKVRPILFKKKYAASKRRTLSIG
jgi:hypothetical protein